MTQLLETAVAELRKLSDIDQDAIATLILAEISDERRWDEEFASSQDALARLAAKVRDDVNAGRVSKIGFDEL
jgi:hypothetical protein